MANFASPSQLLLRCNAKILLELAVPTDMLMPAPENFRKRLLGQSLGGAVSADELAVLDSAVEKVSVSLLDSSSLMRGFGFPAPAVFLEASPAQVVPDFFVRICCDLAVYALKTAAAVASDLDNQSHDATMKLLKAYQKGEISVALPSAAVASAGDSAFVESAPPRYSHTSPIGGLND